MLRYTTTPFPSYSYVPGRFPHPIRDPRGHSYGHEVPTAPPPTPESWRESASYLRGVDLFNHGFYWEAHEAWEAAWIDAGRRGLVADFLKALIKLAAAGVKAREGREAGVRRHALRCAELLTGLESAECTCLLGLQLEDLMTAARRIASDSLTVTERARTDPEAAALRLQLVLAEH